MNVLASAISIKTLQHISQYLRIIIKLHIFSYFQMYLPSVGVCPVWLPYKKNSRAAPAVVGLIHNE